MSERWEIRQGDALALLRDLPSQSVDALITDPPYSSGGMFRGDRSQSVGAKYITNSSPNQGLADFTGDNRDQRSFGYWCALWLGECHRAMKPEAPAMIFTDWRQLPMVTDVFQAAGFIWRGIVPWHKPTSRPQRGRFANECEFVVWGTPGPRPSEGECLPGFFDLPAYIEAAAPRDREHMTQKPVDLMRALVKICRPGGLVLDPFCGAGSTGVAALAEGYRFLGFDLSGHFAGVSSSKLTEAESGYRPDSDQLGMFDVAAV